MSEPITYVGIDAHKHKVDLHVALLAPGKPGPVSWTVPNEVRAVDRLHRKLERAVSGPVACCTKRDRAAMRCSGRSIAAGSSAG